MTYYQRNREKLLVKAKKRYEERRHEKILYSREYYKNNTEKIKEYRKSQKVVEKSKIYSKKYYYSNLDKVKEYRLKNADKISESRKKTWPLYKEKYKNKLRANKARYKYAKRKSAPKWLTKEQLMEIKQFYDKATRLTETTKIEHQVDHIVPLRGKIVSGLHVPWNLQILTRQENRKKGNKLYENS